MEKEKDEFCSIRLLKSTLKKLKLQAIKEDKHLFEVLEDAVQLYLNKKGG